MPAETTYGDIFEEIRETVSLTEEMENHGILLRPSGRTRMRCCCPFPDHSDGTPSFFVYVGDSPETFYCFGCKKHGTVIDFAMYYGKDGQKELTLKEAVEYLLDKYNISSDMLDLSRINKIPNKYKRNEPPIFSKALLLSEEIRNFFRQSLDLDRDFGEVKDYMKNIDEAIYGKDYGTIEVFDGIISKALKGMRKTDELYQSALVCKKCNECDLRAYSENTVFGSGSYKAKTFFVGDSPSFSDNQNKKIFSDDIGLFFREILMRNKIDFKKIWLTNCMCCSTSKQKELSDKDMKFCTNIFFKKQIETIKPSTLIVMGDRAKNILLPKFKDVSIVNLWGKITSEEIYGHKVQVVFSVDPKYVFNSGGFNSEAYNKFARIISKAIEI